MKKLTQITLMLSLGIALCLLLYDRMPSRVRRDSNSVLASNNQEDHKATGPNVKLQINPDTGNVGFDSGSPPVDKLHVYQGEYKATKLKFSSTNSLLIGGHTNPSIRIDMLSGKVTLDPKLTLDESSKLFWESIQKAYPDVFPDCAKEEEKP